VLGREGRHTSRISTCRAIDEHGTRRRQQEAGENTGNPAEEEDSGAGRSKEQKKAKEMQMKRKREVMSKKHKKGKKAEKEKDDTKRGDKKKKRKRQSRTDSSSNDDSSTESNTSSSSSSSSEDTDSSTSTSSKSSVTGRKVKKKKTDKKKMENEKNWELLSDMWPLEARPVHLQKKRNTLGMTLDMLLRCKEQYEKEAEKKGLGSAVYGRDVKVRPKTFKKMTDDGRRKLHPARWERLPVVEPKKYWGQLPTKRDQIFQHIPLQHYGLDGQISELTVVRMHDRKVPVELEMLTREKITEVKHCMEAIVNYAVVCQTLWPTDYGPLVIMKVLTDSIWGEGSGLSEKQKVTAIKRTFDDVVRENSGRAVRKEVPLDYEKVRAR
jgi:hypothetical protein